MDQQSLWDCNNGPSWISFEEAREFSHSLKLRNKEEWNLYIKGQMKHLVEKPVNIPSDPDIQYRFLGWKTWYDWLGVGKPSVEDKPVVRGENIFQYHTGEFDMYTDFSNARAFSRALGFEYKEEWEVYIGGKFIDRPSLPENIPPNPDMVYRFTGWEDWKDWLINPENRKDYANFTDARDFIRCLRLRTKNEYREIISQKDNIIYLNNKYNPLPDKPDLEYADSGWIDWDDFLGTDIEYHSCEETKQFVHTLGLRSEKEWRKYCSGELSNRPSKPENVFTRPDIAYKDNGWISWDDWLGIGTQIHEEKDSEELIECRCGGKIKDCPECDGKGYISID